MRDIVKNLFIRLRNDDKGVTLVEYGIALSLAVAVGTGALLTLGDDVEGVMGDASAVMQPAAQP